MGDTSVPNHPTIMKVSPLDLVASRNHNTDDKVADHNLSSTEQKKKMAVFLHFLPINNFLLIILSRIRGAEPI